MSQEKKGSLSHALKHHVLSDTGKVRTHNEDCYGADPTIGLYIVCDGMGGHQAGEIAAKLAVQTVKDMLRQHHERFGEERLLERSIHELLIRAVLQACTAIFQQGQTDPDKRGMGTTITMLWFLGSRVFVGHVGDSRAYLIRDEQTYPLTEDHTLTNELIKQGTFTQEQVRNAPFKHALSRSLGLYPTVQVDTFEMELMPNDLFMLCTDGLHNYLDTNDQKPHTFYSKRSVEEATRQLLEFALEEGGRDNITVMSIKVPAVEDSQAFKRTRDTLDTIQKIELFEGLNYKDFIRLYNSFLSIDRAKGDYIIRQGDPGDALYILISGKVKVLRDGQELARLLDGQHFGEMALIDNSPRFADIVAVENCHLIYITREDFEALMEEEPILGVRISRNMLKNLAKIVRQQSIDSIDIFVHSRDTIATTAFSVEDWEDDS